MTEQVYLTTEENNAAAEAVSYYKVLLVHRLNSLIELYEHAMNETSHPVLNAFYDGQRSSLVNLKWEVKEGKI